MTFEEENSELGKSFIKRFYLDEYKSDNENGNRNRIELQTSYVCNLDCKYCYVSKHHDELYNEVDDETLYGNAEMVIDWLIENDYNPSIDYFGGEVFARDINYDILHMMLDKLSTMENPPSKIVIPTNCTWIKDDDKIDKIEELLNKSRDVDIPIKLSASIDGKYCADNRPPIMFDDDDYDRLFKFTKKWNMSYHPMIYSEEIEKWKDNWEWFQHMFEKHDMNFANIYLLEVRNREWSKEQINDLGEFIKWLIDWTIDYVGKENYIDFLFDDGFNILRNPFTTVGRGMGCSIQSSMFVRLSDLTFNPCHRMSYDEFELGHFKTKKGSITDIHIDKPELLIGHTAADNNTFPVCEDCPIQNLCSGQCLGASYEYVGEPFTPIPNVCRMEHKKVASMIEKYKEIGILNRIKSRVKTTINKDIEFMEGII